MKSFNSTLLTIGSFVWGPFLLIPLLLGTGIVLTIRLRGLQVRKLVSALRLGLFDRKDEGGEGDVSQYQALAMALAATVGVGNIVGVATAISVGGPGALFWMWVTGLIGMASKYSEAFLGVRFRTTDAAGEQAGGPQYYLERGLKNGFGKFLAIFFAVAATIASFGIGNMTQANAVATNLNSSWGIDPMLAGTGIFILTGAVLLGGVKSIGAVAAAFVPMMIVLYVGGGLWVLAMNAADLPAALGLIFTDAFTGTAAAGGFLGSGILLVLQMGVARGIFSNESGMGSGAIAAAAATTTHPVRQGLVSMTQTFIDTIVVVSITGLAIVTTGTWKLTDSETGVLISAGAMTSKAYEAGLPGDWGGYIVAISVVFFAFSTLLGWSYYGERSFERLVGRRGTKPYRWLFTFVAFVGATLPLEPVWNISDIANALMALPNLVGLLLLSGLVARETKAYLEFDPQLRASADQVEDFLIGQGQEHLIQRPPAKYMNESPRDRIY